MIRFIQSCQPSLLAGRFSVLEAFSPSLYFRRNLSVSENNQFSSIKVIVYKNDMRKTSLFPFNNLSGSA